MAKRKSLREIAATTPATQQLEASIVKGCLKWLNDLPQSEFQKRHGARTRSGDPDITGCLEGAHWEIEVKRKPNVPTERQYSRLETWSKAGAIVCWVSSKAQLQEVVRLKELGCEPMAMANLRSEHFEKRGCAHNLV